MFCIIQIVAAFMILVVPFAAYESGPPREKVTHEVIAYSDPDTSKSDATAHREWGSALHAFA